MRTSAGANLPPLVEAIQTREQGPTLLPCGPSGETRTPDILFPKRFSVFFIVVYSSLWNYPLQSNYFLALLFPLFPSAPALSVVKHVVKEPFLTRCGIRCRRLSRRAFFHTRGLRYCTSGKA